MKFIKSKTDYDAMQFVLLQQIITTIHREVADAGLSDEMVEQLTSSITFGVCVAIDGSAGMQFYDKPLYPIVTFSTDGELKSAITCGGPTWMHEYALGEVEEYFQSLPNEDLSA
ncbi:MAG TPA: hypothetical protein VNW52_10670 [Burkholderiaceae bacterium]|jgi:hypothetical protein|nr:hypothetical protein [Burkholderiaceae bacterium]